MARPRATFSLDSFLNSFNQKMEPPVREHLKNVYSCVAISTLAAAAGGYVHLFTNLIQGSLLTTLGAIAFLLALYATPDDGKNRKMRLGFLVAFAFCSGLGLGPLLDLVIMVDPKIIPTAFLGSTFIFICFTLSAFYSDERQWIYLGGTLMSLLSTMLMLSIANLIIGSQLLFQVHLYLGLALVCGFILYDTQLIIEKRRQGDRDFIWHSVDIFIDFMDVFRRILILLAQKEQQNKRRKD